MPDDTLEIPQQSPKLLALYSDPVFMRLRKTNRKRADMVEAAVRNHGKPSPAPSAIAGASGRIAPGKTFKRPIMTEVARKAKMGDEAAGILQTATELQNLYQNKIKPKLDSGQIGSVGQGLDYSYANTARALGGKLDPDVQEFITKSGPFATQVNAYYSASQGSRGGAQQYQLQTVPHIPHPPTGAIEVLGLSPESSQWDLQKQGEALPQIIDYVNLQEKQRSPKTYGGPSSALTAPYDDKAMGHGVDW